MMDAWSGLDQRACLFPAAEIASSMRGRALACEVFQFSFREVQGADERLRQALLASS